ncbi:MAG: iron-containing alcohol dehydrogenase [Erysipelotrichaceae bacterium]|nr:iron-containing alcohol dehydrogenase [Erysipelotrichaceae bacterium]MDY5252113.1 iron-containing alcohol dehydrogenase [Erysipelotrichaceae bacterium]
MQVYKQLYCRSFQTAFKIAIPFLPYRKPVLIDSLKKLPDIIRKEHAQRVLLVTDKGIRKAKLDEQILDILMENGIDVTIYDKTQPNPTIRNIEEGAAIYQLMHCQLLIALGGGSAMDCAKGIGARIARPKKPIPKMKGILKVLKPIPPLIAIPTTAGTGSECTLAAVISDPTKQEKYPINDFVLIPRYALLDPQMTVSLPPFLTATTGLDALTHAVEAYIGRSSTKDTRQESLQAIALIFANLTTAYDHPQDLTARKNMANAAYLAGLAFTKSYVGYVHAIAHSLGGFYRIAHGHANAVILPIMLKAYGPSIYQKLKQCAIAAGIADNKTPAKEAAESFIGAIDQLNKRFAIPTTFQQIKIEDIPAMSRHADKEANPLYPVPVLKDAKELEPYYYQLINQEVNYGSPSNS